MAARIRKGSGKKLPPLCWHKGKDKALKNRYAICYKNTIYTDFVFYSIPGGLFELSDGRMFTGNFVVRLMA